jgi:hypothetical protein
MARSGRTILSVTTALAWCSAPAVWASSALPYEPDAGLTTLNLFGMLLVYGLGLIVVATLLNMRRHSGRPAAETAAPVPAEAAERLRLRRAASEQYIYPSPTGARAEMLQALVGALAATGHGFHVTNRADLIRHARPPGVSDADWHRALAALKMSSDFTVLDEDGHVVASVEFSPAGPSPSSRAREEALAAIGLPILRLGTETSEAEIARLRAPAHGARAAQV